MKVSIFGAGAFGTTLAQVLIDNNHDVLIYETDIEKINKIKKNIHPFFDVKLSSRIKATNNLENVCKFSNIYLLVIPSKFVRSLLTDIVNLNIIKEKVNFISAVKGLEPETFLMISDIIKEVIPSSILGSIATITGPSHAEEVILRKLTLLTAASLDEEFSKKVQLLFTNKKYLRVYRSDDIVGAEIGGSIKNAIAILTGYVTGLNLGENARAGIITRGLVEIKRLIKSYNGNPDTAYGLTGLGDLVVTASSYNSRNFKAGLELAKGHNMNYIIKNEKQTIEGFRSIFSAYEYAKKNNLSLPLIQTAHAVLNNEINGEEAIKLLLERELKEE